MMAIRNWATPLTMGAFCLMAVTGILMFFHLDSGFNKAAHEWLGWAMVLGAAGHAVSNWQSIKRYLTKSNLARGIVALCLLVLALSFIPAGGKGEMKPPVLAMNAIAKAPVGALAPLTGKTADQIIAELATAGIIVPNAEASLESVVQGDRQLQGRAMTVLFGNH